MKNELENSPFKSEIKNAARFHERFQSSDDNTIKVVDDDVVVTEVAVSVPSEPQTSKPSN